MYVCVFFLFITAVDYGLGPGAQFCHHLDPPSGAGIPYTRGPHLEVPGADRQLSAV